MNRIVWLASYPKSGNTWFRAFISNLLSMNDQETSINELGSGPIASSRPLFDEHVGIPSADLNSHEEGRLRPLVYQRVSEQATEPVFIKVHDAYNLNRDGMPLFPPSATKGVIYLLRNPFDVAISYAHHNASSIDRAIELMANDDHYLSPRNGSLSGQLPQRLRSWAAHANSWLDAPDMPVHLIRYEDLKKRPFEIFSRAVEFLGLEVTPDKITQAMEFASFERLKQQETEKGFAEKPIKAAAFFRSGRSGGWRRELTRSQWERIWRDQQAGLARFHYLEECAWED